jgi:hypothetical protein
MKTMICPKTSKLVDSDSCEALRNMSIVRAEFFATTVCMSVAECPKEDYCSVFDCGWNSVNDFLFSTLGEKQ